MSRVSQDWLFESNTTALATSSAIIVLALIIHRLYLSFVTLDPLAGFDWVGLEKEHFAKWRANLRSLTNMRQTLIEGYDKYSKLDKPYVHPNVASGAVINLPPSVISELIAAPENVLSAHEPLVEGIQAYWTLGGKDIIEAPWPSILSRKLTRCLPELTPAISEEIALAVDEEWGLETDWRDIVIGDTCMQIVSRVTNRLLVGAPLCRNKEFLESACSYSTAIVIGGWILRMFPLWIKWPLSKLVLIPNHRYLQTCLRHIKPLIAQRKADLQQKARDPTYDWAEPQDAIRWFLEEAERNNRPAEADPDAIGRRIAFLNFVAIHTTTVTTTNALLDLLSAAPSNGFVEGLREECDRVLAKHDGAWTKDGVSQLWRVDSTLRESMRLNAIQIRGLERTVKSTKGYTFKNGIHVPRDARLSVPLWGIHHDDDNYDNGDSYDAFRFSRPREAHDGLDEISVNDAEAQKRILALKNMSMTAVGNTFLPFGHGSHTCPGRFFAANETKLLLAYLIQHYDIEHLIKRPENIGFNENWVPDMKAKLRIRRRKTGFTGQ